MRVLLRAGLMAAAVAACAGAWAQDGAPCHHPKTQQDLPQVLGPGFVREATHSYEAQLPGGGCSVRYKHPAGMWADVFIYRAGHGVIEDTARDPRLMAEFQQALSGIVQGWKQKNKGVVRDTEAKYVQRGDARIEVMTAVAVIEVPDVTTYRTHVQLWSGGGSIWKLRATFSDADRAVSDPAIEALGNALVDLSRETAQ
ncbi:hypothetical protein [Roseateles sp.]|uniref:hypothetical protein n=1 Tax=Roseateles sp. TaxID=1971397 RepID=UPI003265149E